MSEIPSGELSAVVGILFSPGGQPRFPRKSLAPDKQQTLDSHCHLHVDLRLGLALPQPSRPLVVSFSLQTGVLEGTIRRLVDYGPRP